MGLTPLEGLVMGTRSGDLDPGVVFHLLRNAGMDADEIDNLLNRRSGMVGLSGVSDFRDLHKLIADGRRRRRDRRWTSTATGCASTSAPTWRCWAARTSSRSPPASGRTTASSGRKILEGLEPLGISVDADRNAVRSSEPRVISPDGSPVTVMVVPTNEELAIAQATVALVG